jgi:hypothetical protein
LPLKKVSLKAISKDFVVLRSGKELATSQANTRSTETFIYPNHIPEDKAVNVNKEFPSFDFKRKGYQRGHETPLVTIKEILINLDSLRFSILCFG